VAGHRQGVRLGLLGNRGAHEGQRRWLRAPTGTEHRLSQRISSQRAHRTHLHQEWFGEPFHAEVPSGPVVHPAKSARRSTPHPLAMRRTAPAARRHRGSAWRGPAACGCPARCAVVADRVAQPAASAWGRPAPRPRALAAHRPAGLRSCMRCRAPAASAATIGKASLPVGEVVSSPWCRRCRPIPS
jgi:hypothetical protein